MSYLTSSTLIDSIKNRALIPTNQVTFSNTDFLRFANEEMQIGILPSILQYHEEYLLHQDTTTIVESKLDYTIPYRSIGNKLRDVSLQDSAGNVYKMARIQVDEIPIYSGYSYNNMNRVFYLLNNKIMMLASNNPLPSGAELLITYYMRPSKLVDEDRVGTIQSIADEDDLTFATTDVNTGTDVITINSHGLVNGVSLTLSSSGTLPAGLEASTTYYVISATANTFKLSAEEDGDAIDITSVGSGTHTLTPNLKVLTLTDEVPTVITTSVLIDLLQKNSPHKIYAYDITPIGASGSEIKIKTEDYPDDLEAGDLVALAGECSIPQIPDELHSILAQRVACRCLEALGDREGLTAANAKLAEMESRIANLIDNRVEGSPQKVVNHNSPLKSITARWGN